MNYLIDTILDLATPMTMTLAETIATRPTIFLHIFVDTCETAKETMTVNMATTVGYTTREAIS